MAHFCCGNNDPELIDPAMVAALRQLDDDFFIFLETDFDDRNADVTIFRASEDRAQPSTLIVTEVKRFVVPVRGTTNGQWEREVASGIWAPVPSSGRDISPYRQAVNTAHSVSAWLYNYQRYFLESPGHLVPETGFRAWPDLVLLSPPAIRHQLPLRAPNNFGFWFDSVEAWVDHLRRWTPKKGIGLKAGEIEAIAATLHLAPYEANTPHDVSATPMSSAATRLASQLHQLEVQAAAFQRDVATIRSILAGLTLA